jgi:peptide/nickel transport system permease protein
VKYLSKTSVRAASLTSYIIRRILEAIPLLFAVIIINFTLIHIAPGDPISYFLGENVVADPAYMALIRKTFGLDQPLYVQLFLYIWSMIRGDLGFSFIRLKPVLSVIVERVPATLLLMLTGLIFSSIFGILLGVASSRKPHSLGDYAITIGSLSGYSIPTFWLGQMLLLGFGLYLHWFPIGGITSVTEEFVSLEYVRDVLWHLTLPAITLGVWYLALITRLTRSSMLEVLRLNFIVTARAKGLVERKVFYKHALKNALLPVITVIGLNFGMMFGGAVLTETVFGWPGLGRLMLDSTMSRDYPTLMGLFIFVSFAVIATNLVTDIVYCVLDPRIRYK